MKKIFILHISILAIFLNYSCSTTELMDYEGTEGIYFYVQRVPISGYGDTTIWSANATSLIEFTKTPAVDTTLNLRVRITGPVKDYDRPFEIRVNKDSTTAIENVNYEVGSFEKVIKANMHYADVPIKIIRADNLQKEEVRVTLELLPNENFNLAFNELYSLSGSLPMDRNDEGHNPAFHSVYMNYLIVRPTAWVPAIDYETGQTEAGLLGAFTMKKFSVINEVCKVTYDEFASKDIMPQIRVQAIQQQMKAYLINQFNNGTPVLEDDGRLMWVMEVPWQSTVGVSYVPDDK